MTILRHWRRRGRAGADGPHPDGCCGKEGPVCLPGHCVERLATRDASGRVEWHQVENVGLEEGQGGFAVVGQFAGLHHR